MANSVVRLPASESRPDYEKPIIRYMSMASQREEVLQKIIENGIVAVIRAETPEQVKGAVKALKDGGVLSMEITFTVPNAVEMIRQTHEAYGNEILLGAGTVTTPSDAAAAITAGARYIVSPNTNPEIIRLCNVLEAPVMPGAMTPTEVLNAWQAGADIVKVFPAEVLGPRYIKALRGPYPDIRLMPTGGVTAENAGEWLAVGCTVLAAGSSLVDKQAMATGEFEIISDKARQFIKAVQDFRNT